MAYQSSNPPKLLHRSVNGDSPAIWSYASNDSAAEVGDAGYFANATNIGLRAGDFILASDVDNNYAPILHCVSTVASGVGTVADVTASGGGSGWAQYADTVYTSGSPLLVLADTDTLLPNNKGGVLEGQLPSDIATFYDGTVITGRNGDDITITVDMKALPTSAGTTYIEVWFDIGGAVGELYRRIVSFPKGNGVVRPINFTVSGYTLGTWEANGATAYVRANGPVSIYDIRYVISRNHKAV